VVHFVQAVIKRDVTNVLVIQNILLPWMGIIVLDVQLAIASIVFNLYNHKKGK
jgi:hypothetical protein